MDETDENSYKGSPIKVPSTLMPSDILRPLPPYASYEFSGPSAPAPLTPYILEKGFVKDHGDAREHTATQPNIEEEAAKPQRFDRIGTKVKVAQILARLAITQPISAAQIVEILGDPGVSTTTVIGLLTDTTIDRNVGLNMTIITDEDGRIRLTSEAQQAVEEQVYKAERQAKILRLSHDGISEESIMQMLREDDVEHQKKMAAKKQAGQDK